MRIQLVKAKALRSGNNRDYFINFNRKNNCYNRLFNGYRKLQKSRKAVKGSFNRYFRYKLKWQLKTQYNRYNCKF